MDMDFTAPLVQMEYPDGCQDILEEMSVDELLRRLKVLASTFSSMGQEEGTEYVKYVPLCLILAGDEFLEHSNKDVQLLVACCIADILRIYAPDAPYKDNRLVLKIFRFFVRQLKGLKDLEDKERFKRCSYILENLAHVKCFNMCIDLDDGGQDIISSLFELMFSVYNEKQTTKVKELMFDALYSLVNDEDSISSDLLDIILINLPEPLNYSKEKYSCNLAHELVIKCLETLEPHIKNLFQSLLSGANNDSVLASKVYELLYELSHICSTLLLSVIPQLELKLRSIEDSDRKGCVSFLARMFSEKDSMLAIDHVQLWQAFLGRFNDINVSIRTKCVQCSYHILMNHPDLRPDIVEALRMRQHDADENVRLGVVKAIVATIKSDFNIVGGSEDLLNYVKERTLDKKFKIRREAVQGLALIYKKHLEGNDAPLPMRRAVNWMKNQILHLYYLNNLDDRILIEKLLDTCFVPFQLEPYERMMKLLYFYGTIDSNASKAFVEIQKNLILVRRNVAEFLNTIRNEHQPDHDRKLNLRISHLTKWLPDPVKASEFLCKFSADLKQDQRLLCMMEIIVSPDTNCKTCAESTNVVLKKLGLPVMTNLYYNTIKLLLERTSSLMVDKVAVMKLMVIINEIVAGKEEVMDALGLDKDTAIEKGLSLLGILAFVFPHHFCDEGILNKLLQLLELVGKDQQPKIIAVLTCVGKTKPMGQFYIRVMDTIVLQCMNMLVHGSPEQSKQSVRCLHINIVDENARNHLFGQVVETLRTNMERSHSTYRTAIVALGHIAFLMPEVFKNDMKPIISLKIVKNLLVNPPRTDDDRYDNSDSWCDEDKLPELTRCMLAAMKTTSRWVLGLKNDLKAAQKTYKMLAAFVETSGDFIQNNLVPFSNAEKSWLRLVAGCCMLKISEQKGVGDEFTASQFFVLSKLMNDDVFEVRSRFAYKLHKGLSRGIPHKCLPLDFMGFYSLAGYETNEKHKDTVRNYMIVDVDKRRECIKPLMMAASERVTEQLPMLMPDYMFVFSVPVLAHNRRFTLSDKLQELIEIKECLWFILEPLITKSTRLYEAPNRSISFGFFKSAVERMKNHKDAMEPDNEDVNFKMYAVCDTAMGLILQKYNSFDVKDDYPLEPRIPPMYFRKHEDPNYRNTQTYLPLGMPHLSPKAAGFVNSESINLKEKRNNFYHDGDKVRNNCIDLLPNDAAETRLQLPGIQSSGSNEDVGSNGIFRNRSENPEPRPQPHNLILVDLKPALDILQVKPSLTNTVSSKESERVTKTNEDLPSNAESTKSNLESQESDDSGRGNSKHRPRSTFVQISGTIATERTEKVSETSNNSSEDFSAAPSTKKATKRKNSESSTSTSSQESAPTPTSKAAKLEKK